MGEQFSLTISEAPRKIKLSEIQENPHNPRKSFDEAGIQEIANNIEVVGLLQPIKVRPVDGQFQIVYGHRRYRAVKMLEWETIPATVAKMSDKEAYEVSLSENILRADLSAIEEAEGFQRLMDEFDYTQQLVAEKFGKSQPFIASRLVLLKLPESIQDKIITRVINPSHGELLAKINDAELQIKLASEVERDSLSVRELEHKIKDLTPEQSPEQPEPSTQEAIGESEEQTEAPVESESTEKPQEAEVIEEEEPEQANDEAETQKKSEAEEDEQLTLISKSQGEKSNSSQSKSTFENKYDREDSKYLPSELLILTCLDEQLQEEFKENLALLNEYTHKVPRQENIDDAIEMCVNIENVALSMKENLEKSKMDNAA